MDVKGSIHKLLSYKPINLPNTLRRKKTSDVGESRKMKDKKKSETQAKCKVQVEVSSPSKTSLNYRTNNRPSSAVNHNESPEAHKLHPNSAKYIKGGRRLSCSDDWQQNESCEANSTGVDILQSPNKLVRSSSCQTINSLEDDELIAVLPATRKVPITGTVPDIKELSDTEKVPALSETDHVTTAKRKNLGMSNSDKDAGVGPSLSSEEVTLYLQNNPEFLDQYLMENVDLETLERWMIRRSQREKMKQTIANGTVDNSVNSKIVRKTSLSRWKFCVHADKRKMLADLTASLHSKPSKDHALWELSRCISSAINADSSSLYLVEGDCLRSYQESPDEKDHFEENDWSVAISEGSYLCAFVAKSRQGVRVSAPISDSRYPQGCVGNEDDCAYVLSMPVIQSSGGQLEGVMEFYRCKSSESFHEEDEEIVNSYLVWGGIAIHYADLYKHQLQQKKLNDFMLSVVKSIFQDMVSMDNLIMKVMNFAQTLVSADRASLFLLDSKSKFLYARIFDMGMRGGEGEGDVTPKVTEEIRFPVGTGIAGIVAQSGEVLNISDAYSDDRFNRSVDQLTGYVTKAILCMPIYIRGNVIGVMQMVNKTVGTGFFNKQDEESFEMFAVYCGLALHHAKLYDKIRRSEQKYKVALEIMSYHSNDTENGFTQLVDQDFTVTTDVDVDQFYFSAISISDLDKVRHTIYMFVDLFGLNRFEKEALIRFTLTIKKNYRRVPYHNWSHGFSVCNSMYTIIKNNPTTFKPLECLSLFVGALCHDLDHRGKNNKFMIEFESPLAAIYTTSTLERHHFNQTVTILQQEGHNIFSKLTSSEYKQVLSNIKHCILATDLALFFPTKAKLNKLLDENQFDWENLEHRLLVEAITMTACDLCASTKPWEVQVETVKVIFEEFYEQGDAEKAAGKTPMPMMDRTKAADQPMSQVGFLKGICIPCYELLLKLIPVSYPMLDGCKTNLTRWQKIADEAKKKVEELEAKEAKEGQESQDK